MARSRPVDVAAALKRSGAEVVVNYLPVGREEATIYYAEAKTLLEQFIQGEIDN